MNIPPATRLTSATASIGVVLHLYVAVFKADGGFSLFLAGLLLLSWLPYIIAAGIAYVKTRAVFGLGFAVAALVGDAVMHHAVFIAPTSSTAGLGLLVMPVLNLFVLGPVGGIVFWLVYRFVFAHRG